MRMRQRARMHAAGDQAREVRHVDEEIGADRIRDLAEALEVPEARIGGTAGEDQLRLVLLGQFGDLVHVELLVLRPHGVRDRLEPLARLIDRRAVREVTARGEIEPEERVAGLQQREEHRLVGGRPGMRLHVGEGAVEQLLGAVDRDRFRDVDELAAAVVAPTRIAFGILVREAGALRFQHGARHDVLGRDQLDLVLLAIELLADRAEHLGIALGQAGSEEAGHGGIGLGRHLAGPLSRRRNRAISAQFGDAIFVTAPLEICR